jgi:hypothetical protein
VPPNIPALRGERRAEAGLPTFFSKFPKSIGIASNRHSPVMKTDDYLSKRNQVKMAP